MRNYTLEDKYKVVLNTGTDGCQPKYKRGDFWYKVDKQGREGYVENLITKLLNCSTLPKSNYTHYEYCTINNKSGCKSRNFLNKNEQIVSFHALFNLTYGRDIANSIYTIQDTKERLDLLLKLIKEACNVNIYNYLKTTFLLDMLIQNRDRHMRNLAIIYNEKTEVCRECPIFDNGLSLGTGLSNSDKSIARSISGSFEEQVIAFGYPIQTPFKIEYTKAFKILDTSKESQILKHNLLKYESIFRK